MLWLTLVEDKIILALRIPCNYTPFKSFNSDKWTIEMIVFPRLKMRVYLEILEYSWNKTEWKFMRKIKMHLWNRSLFRSLPLHLLLWSSHFPDHLIIEHVCDSMSRSIYYHLDVQAYLLYLKSYLQKSMVSGPQEHI